MADTPRAKETREISFHFQRPSLSQAPRSTRHHRSIDSLGGIAVFGAGCGRRLKGAEALEEGAAPPWEPCGGIHGARPHKCGALPADAGAPRRQGSPGGTADERAPWALRHPLFPSTKESAPDLPPAAAVSPPVGGTRYGAQAGPPSGCRGSAGGGGAPAGGVPLGLRATLSSRPRGNRRRFSTQQPRLAPSSAVPRSPQVLAGAARGVTA